MRGSEIAGFYLRSPFKELVGPTLEELEAVASQEDVRQVYFRPRTGLVLPAQIEASLRQIFREGQRPTTSERTGCQNDNWPPPGEAASSNVTLMVRPRGLEPPRPKRPLGPQPSASTNSATGA